MANFCVQTPHTLTLTLPVLMRIAINCFTVRTNNLCDMCTVRWVCLFVTSTNVVNVPLSNSWLKVCFWSLVMVQTSEYSNQDILLNKIIPKRIKINILNMDNCE